MRHSNLVEGREPTQEARAVPRINAGFTDVPGHHGAGADDDVVANYHRKDGRIRSDADMTANFCGPPEIPLPHGGTSNGERIVDEHGAMRYKTVITDGHHVTNENMRLNPAAFADDGAALDVHERHDGTDIGD